MSAFFVTYNNPKKALSHSDKFFDTFDRLSAGFRKAHDTSLSQTQVGISDDSGRIAMLEKRIIGTDDSLPSLTRYVYFNHLQSASLELDEYAAIVSYEEYHPYGTTAFQAKNAAINAVAKRYRYTGKERDEESGLYLRSFYIEQCT